MNNDADIKKSLISSLGTNINSKIEDFVIKDKNAFLTLKADSPEDAKKLDGLKIECENKLKETKYFKKVYVTFTIVKKKFKNIVAITSCKGGVGKSTVASNLALFLNSSGYKVGILDADIYGPSIPSIFDLEDKPDVNTEKKIIPLNFKGIEIISIGLMIDKEIPIIWRGPMIQTALMQLVSDVKWDDLDFLIIDLPPGTGDPHLTLLQKLKVTHSLVVTTNEDIALADTRKGINMLKKLNVPITGVIENMSYLKCKKCDEKHFIFGKNGVKKLCQDFNLKLLAKIPILTKDKNKISFNEYEELLKIFSVSF